MTPLLHGLVLAGGRSTRMQRDKATITYAGQTQLERALALVAPFVARAFVSVRADQVGDPARARFAQIVDREPGLGPIGGIMAAQAEFPAAAWLVVACDLPFLDARTLDHLLRERQPGLKATAYRSSHDGLPEPLCAIYEPSSRESLAAYVASGRKCPRKFLLAGDVQLLDELNPRALDNINTPEEYSAAMERLSTGPAPAHKHIQVQYYALLREQTGRSAEALVTSARTPRELYQELKSRYPLSLAPEMLRVAVNSEFGEWSQPLADGDAVVFIPPVAGG